MAANISNNVTRPAEHSRSHDPSRDLSSGSAVQLMSCWEDVGSQVGGANVVGASHINNTTNTSYYLYRLTTSVPGSWACLQCLECSAVVGGGHVSVVTYK